MAKILSLSDNWGLRGRKGEGEEEEEVTDGAEDRVEEEETCSAGAVFVRLRGNEGLGAFNRPVLAALVVVVVVVVVVRRAVATGATWATWAGCWLSGQRPGDLEFALDLHCRQLES